MTDKKSLICEAVFKLLNYNDISSVTISMIAEEANIGKGTVYEYFDSKEDIFICAFDKGFELFIAKLETALLSVKLSFKEVIYKLLDINIELLKNNRSFFNLVINPPMFLVKNIHNKDSSECKLLYMKNKIQSLLGKILENALVASEIKKADKLRQTLFLPMIMSFLNRITRIGYWYDIPEDIDIEKEKEEFFEIVLGLFS